MNFKTALVKRFKRLITRIEHEPEDQHHSLVINGFEDANGQKNMQDAWQIAWSEVLEETALPERPKKQKKSLLGMIKKEKPAGTKGKVLTVKEWEQETKRIKKSNAKAKAVWADIAKQSDLYLPPEKVEERLVKSMMEPGISDIKLLIDAFRQVAIQSGDIYLVFDKHQNNPNLDLALLAVSYQQHEHFLGSNSLLKKVLKSQKAAEKAKNFPLISKYLPDYV